MVSAFMSPQCTLSSSILEILEGSELVNTPSLFRCPTCYSKRQTVYYGEIASEIPPCCFRLSCNRHSPAEHKFFCVKHGAFFKLRKSLLRHERFFACSSLESEPGVDAPPPAVPPGEYAYPFLLDSDDDTEPPDTMSPIDIFKNLPCFTSFLPPSTVHEHFQDGPGNDLSSKSQTFFIDELSQPGSGAKRLVANSFNPQAHLLRDDELPSSSETYVHLLIASFLLTLTTSQKHTFSTIINLLIPSAIAIGKHGTSPVFSSGKTRIPTSNEDIRHIYTEHSSSILKNIPAPLTLTPRRDGKTYSFSSYYDCTQHFLAWGPPLLDFADEIALENGPLCSRYKEIVDSCCLLSPQYRPLVILFDEWRDKFEGATVKKNRRNVHANTMTFLGPKGSHTNPHYTYTVCIGSGSYNSLAAEKELAPGLNSLMSRVHSFYSGIHKRIVPVLLFPRSSIQDRPERCYSTNILSQGSPLTRRWGWVSNFKYRKLVSCWVCHWRRLRTLGDPHVDITNDRRCYDCGDFEYKNVPELSWNPVDDKYPTECCLCGLCPPVPSDRPVPQEGPLAPHPQTFTWILDCIRYAIHHRIREVWTKDQTLCFLKECGLNKNTGVHIENILVNDVRAQNVYVPDEEILDIVSLPSWTRNFPLHDYIDAPMHLLKGIVMDSMDDSSTWAKLYNCNNRILKVLNGRLEGISQLQLSWLRVLPFGASLTPGGWQSENYIDYSGVQMFNYVVSAHDDSVKLRPRARMELPWVLRFQHLLNCVFSRLLVSNEDYCELGDEYPGIVDEYVKAFLTEMDNMSQVMRKPLAWANKGNPTSMLNFRQMIVRFGPTRRIWDGNRERYVTFLKPFLGNLRNNDTYFGTKLDQINRKKGLNGIIQSFQNVFPEVQLLAPPMDTPARYSRYRVYSNFEKIMFANEGTPVSAVQIRCSVDNEASMLVPDEDSELLRFFVIHRMGRNKKVLRELMVEDDNPQDIHGHHLLQAYPVRMMDLAIIADMLFVQTHIVRSVVFFPYEPPPTTHTGVSDGVPLFWLWSDDRKVLLDCSFQFPSVDTNAFISRDGLPISTWGGSGDPSNGSNRVETRVDDLSTNDVSSDETSDNRCDNTSDDSSDGSSE